MSISEQFGGYALAFEKAYLSDDWSEVKACFHDDAVYEVHGSCYFGGSWKGPAAIIEQFKVILDRFDRRCDKRSVELLSAEERDGAFVVAFKASYDFKDELLVFEGRESASYREGLIAKLEDFYEPEAVQSIESFIDKHSM